MHRIQALGLFGPGCRDVLHVAGRDCGTLKVAALSILGLHVLLPHHLDLGEVCCSGNVAAQTMHRVMATSMRDAC